MILASLAKILSNKHCRAAKRGRPAARAKLQLALERLEDRVVPSTFYVSNTSTTCDGHPIDSSTITGAVALAGPGDKIVVCHGNYTGEGTITLPSSKPGLKIEGEQADHDPAKAGHSGRIAGDPATESVVQEFRLEGNKQEIEGFTITNPVTAETGIVTDAGHSGYEIEYNIFTKIRDNAIEFNSNAKYKNEVEHNWFDSDTASESTATGPIGQFIHSHDGLFHAEIEENLFSGTTTDRTTFSVDIEGVSSSSPDKEIDIEHNKFEHTGNSRTGTIHVSNATDAEVDENKFTDYVGKGIDLTGFLDDMRVKDNDLHAGGKEALDAILALGVFGPKSSKYHVKIVDNDISGGSGTSPGGFGEDGIELINKGAPEGFSPARFYVYDNDISHMGDNGIKLIAVSDSTIKENDCNYNHNNGIFLASSHDNTVERNSTKHNHHDGILVDAFSKGNTFKHNKSFFNTVFDYEDDSVGTGTAGTGNTWIKNKGGTASPGGLIS